MFFDNSDYVTKKDYVSKDDYMCRGVSFKQLVEESLQYDTLQPITESKEKRPDHLRLWSQIFAAFFIAMTHFAVGVILAYPGVTLPELMDKNSTDIVFTDTDSALFTSLVNVGAVIGSLIAGPLMIWFGQKKLLLFALPFILSMWLTQAYSGSVVILQVARMTIGLGQGFVGGTANNYVVEIAHSSIRGNLYSLVDLFRQLGSLFVFLIGSGPFSWRQVAMICGLTSTLIPFIGILFIHDSPRWLSTKGRYEDVRKSLSFYRGPKMDIDSEYFSIKKQLENTSTKGQGLADQFKFLFSKNMRKRMFILSVIMIGVFFTANNIITTYSALIFQQINLDINPYAGSIMIGVSRVVGTVIYALISERFGRRTLFIVPLTAAGISLIGLSFLLYFKYLIPNYFYVYVKWAILSLVSIYTVVSCIGIPVFMLYRSEILPNSVRALGSSVIYMFFFTSNFITSYTYPLLVNIVGIAGAFAFYGICTILLVLFGAFSLPETRGKSLEEIEDTFFCVKK